MTRRIWQASAFALCAVIAMPALAASDHSSGDGSTSDNDRLTPGIYPAAPVFENADGLREPYDPFFDVDWSVALRGGYVDSTARERFETILAPSIALRHQGTRSAIDITGDAEIVRPTDGDIDVTGLRLELQTGYALDSVTALTGSASFALTQDSVGTPGLATDITEAPQTFLSASQLGFTRQFGKFNLGVTGEASRTVYGPTTRADGTVTDNSDQNYWALDSGLRVGLQATPILEVFAAGGLGRDIFDEPASQLRLPADATNSSLRGGVTGRWSSIVEATASVGVARRLLDADAIAETIAYLYDANIVYTPDPTLRLSAGFTTSLVPPGPDSPGNTRVQYAANAQLDYTVNSWLALRALADWRNAQFSGSDEIERGRGFGLGADYTVNAHTAVSADYRYDQSQTTADGIEDAQRYTLGITVSRYS